jgi:predicted MFS family arabinose efflux permease
MKERTVLPFVVYLLGLTIFTLTTAEFMVTGMMPALSAAFGRSVGEIGYLVSWYALGMAIGGPILTALVLALRISDKRALVSLLTLYVVASLLAALATDYTMLAIARIIMGVTSAACIGVSLTVAAELVPAHARGRAASVVLGGLMLAPVFGVPGTALIEQSFGWRASFAAITVFATACTIIVMTCVSVTTGPAVVSLSAELRLLKNRGLWAAYATSGLIIGAALAAVTYFAPVFIGLGGVSEQTVPLLLIAYGVANVIGNFVVGRYADRYTMPILAMGLAALTCSLAGFALLADQWLPSLVAFFLIGLTGVSLNPAMAARVMRAAQPRPLVNTMHTAVITGGIAFGSWAGGAGIDGGYGLTSPLWIGCAMAALGLLSVLPFLAFGARREACPAT